MNIMPESAVADCESRGSISTMSADLLRNLFLHHDGIVVGATVSALHQGGVLEHLFSARKLSLKDLVRRLASKGVLVNTGYLQVALRCLALQGWILRYGDPASDSMEFEVTGTGLMVSRVIDRYTDLAGFVYSGIPMDRFLFGSGVSDSGDPAVFSRLVELCRRRWDLPQALGNSPESAVFEMIGHHLDGMLLGPFMIAAKMQGLLENEPVPLESFPDSRDRLETGMRLLEHFGWAERQDHRWYLTELGQLAGGFSLHYGLTLSYVPMFCNLSRLIFNSSKNVTHVEPGKEEQHVDRVINVLASGVAHRRYFEDSEHMMIELFNRFPLEQQPAFVADMGCGDGEWLKRIYHVVKMRTRRGKHLDQYPLLMIGADYNVKAQEVVQRKLVQAGVPNIVLFGDIGEPEQFSRALAERGIDICDGLHVRAFIDHNRPYRQPQDWTTPFQVLSTGAYADENGNPIPNRDLEQSLCEHLRKWVPYTAKHGIIILEAHNVDPGIVPMMLGKTHATAFDTYHGYSNQYPVDFESFIRQAERAGLRSVVYRQMLYPSRLPFVAISLNHFKAKSSVTALPAVAVEHGLQSSGWKPDGTEDLEDGNALHELLYQHGDLSLPRRWCCYSTGLLVAELLAAIERLFERLNNTDDAKKVIRVVDYGVGTGFATLELIKGLEEKGLLDQFFDAGVDFRLMVCDFPSGWYAKAFELLHDYPFVSFYSLKDSATGKVQMLTDLFPAESVDLVFASMVFHLVPPTRIGTVIDSFAEVLADDGLLLWNTPDTAPALPHSELIHSANRMLRKTIEGIIDRVEDFSDILADVPAREVPEVAGVISRVEDLLAQLSPDVRAQARARARKQVLPVATGLAVIRQAVARCFSGKSWSKLSVMTDEELLALALLPANQRIAGEIQPRALRERFVTLMMKYRILPRIHESPAGLPAGMNLHWTFGSYRKKVRDPSGLPAEE